jgi:hypothetical protein
MTRTVVSDTSASVPIGSSACSAFSRQPSRHPALVDARSHDVPGRGAPCQRCSGQICAGGRTIGRSESVDGRQQLERIGSGILGRRWSDLLRRVTWPWGAVGLFTGHANGRTPLMAHGVVAVAGAVDRRWRSPSHHRASGERRRPSTRDRRAEPALPDDKGCSTRRRLAAERAATADVAVDERYRRR